MSAPGPAAVSTAGHAHMAADGGLVVAAVDDEVENAILDHIEKQHGKELQSMSEDDRRHLKHRISTLLGRSCGCGAL